MQQERISRVLEAAGMPSLWMHCAECACRADTENYMSMIQINQHKK